MLSCALAMWLLVVLLASQVPMSCGGSKREIMAEKNRVVRPFCSEQIGLFIGNKSTDEFNRCLQ